MRRRSLAYLNSQFSQAGEFGSFAGRFGLLARHRVSCRQGEVYLRTVRGLLPGDLELFNSRFRLTGVGQQLAQHSVGPEEVSIRLNRAPRVRNGRVQIAARL